MQRAKDTQPDEIQALKRMKDREIDTGDIPPALDWSKAVVGKFYDVGKRPHVKAQKVSPRPEPDDEMIPKPAPFPPQDL